VKLFFTIHVQMKNELKKCMIKVIHFHTKSFLSVHIYYYIGFMYTEDVTIRWFIRCNIRCNIIRFLSNILFFSCSFFLLQLHWWWMCIACDRLSVSGDIHLVMKYIERTTFLSLKLMERKIRLDHIFINCWIS